MSKISLKNLLRQYPIYLCSVVLFILFKIFFPYPDLFLDSVNYIQWGLDDYQIAFRPLGYSHFLMLLDGLSSNYITIVIIQYLVFLVSTYFFLSSFFSVLEVSNRIKRITEIVILLNPLPFFLANLISPDSLFISLTAFWIGALIRLIFFDQKKYLLLTISLFIFYLLFGLRYNAIYYPFFAIIIILISKLKNTIKLITSASFLLVFLLLYNAACNNAEQNVNTKTLSGFGGWIMANNALHVYDDKDVDSNIWDTPDELMLHRFVLVFKDSAYTPSSSTNSVTDQYMWSKKGPLKMYLYYQLQNRRYSNYLEGWWNISLLYGDFGRKLILNYPGAFIRNYYYPNIKSFFFPSREVLASYNLVKQELSPAWMQYLGVDKKMLTGSTRLQSTVIKSIRLINLPINIICTLCALFFIAYYFLIWIKRKKDRNPTLYALFILSSFYIGSLLILSFAHPILMRYTSTLYIYFGIIPIVAWDYFKFSSRLRTKTRGDN